MMLNILTNMQILISEHGSMLIYTTALDSTY